MLSFGRCCRYQNPGSFTAFSMQRDSKSYAPNGVSPVWLAMGRKPLVTDEPDALIGHVRVCGEGAGQPVPLPGNAKMNKPLIRQLLLP
jgi:hypothetical protein